MKRTNIVLTAAIALATVACGGTGDTAAEAEPEPAPTVTVTETPEPEPAPTVTVTVTETPEPPPPPAESKVEDFDVSLFVKSNKCFNSAGSSVRFEPELSLVGESAVGFEGTLVYAVSAGDEDLGTFSIEVLADGTYRFNEERVSPDVCHEDAAHVAEVVRLRG